MIKALVFDLDGTLIQTEVLKARSYAQAVQQLTSGDVSEEEVMLFFDRLVGLPREEVLNGLVQGFYEALFRHHPSHSSQELSKMLIDSRLDIYHHILKDAELLSNHFCPFTMALFRKAKSEGFLTALATMSHQKEALQVLEVMGIREDFDLILTRDEVEKGKPDPEIYLKAANDLGIRPDECLVMEDSVNGIRAALAAGMPVFALTNSVTYKSVHQSNLLDSKYIVDDLTETQERIFNFINMIS